MSCFESDVFMLDFNFDNDVPVVCMCCEEEFEINKNPQPFLKHLLESHKLIIDMVEEISDLRQYALYWSKLKQLDLEDFCTVLFTNGEPGSKAPKEKYYILNSKLLEDKKLRELIKDAKLKHSINQKQKEIEDVYSSRMCNICKKSVSGGLSEFFSHLSFIHGFLFGHPNNIVFGNQLLDIIEEKLFRMECIYCNKIFRNHTVLKQHMRKKQHRTLNPENKFYDKFYLINYLTPQIHWKDVKKEGSSTGYDSYEKSESLPSKDEWNDWYDDTGASLLCLFCPFVTKNVPFGLFNHMLVSHEFDLEVMTDRMNFYQKVKYVNYIRYQIMNMRCVGCNQEFNNFDVLLSHIRMKKHICSSNANVWDQESFLYPTLENDELLCYLQDSENICNKECSYNDTIYAEDMECITNSVLNEKEIINELMSDGDANFPTICLFCKYTVFGIDEYPLLVDHMNFFHSFDIENALRTVSSNMQEKLISYIRHKNFNRECYYCQKTFQDHIALEEHRLLEGHDGVPSEHFFNTDRYTFLIDNSDGLIKMLKSKSSAIDVTYHLQNCKDKRSLSSSCSGIQNILDHLNNIKLCN